MRVGLTCLGYFTLRVEVPMGWSLNGLKHLATICSWNASWCAIAATHYSLRRCIYSILTREQLMNLICSLLRYYYKVGQLHYSLCKLPIFLNVRLHCDNSYRQFVNQAWYYHMSSHVVFSSTNSKFYINILWNMLYIKEHVR